MRGRETILVGVLALVLAVPSGRACAASPAPVVIDANINLVTGEGTFSATGAIVDSGMTFAAEGPQFDALRSQALSIERTVPEFDGVLGNLTLDFTVRILATPDPSVFARVGTWHVVAGTGAYFGASGEGVVMGTLNFSTLELHDQFIGQVQLGP